MENKLTINSIIELLIKIDTLKPNNDFNSLKNSYYNYMLNFYYDDIRTINDIKNTTSSGGYIYVNEDNSLNWLHDVKKIEFNSLYPLTIVKLLKENKIKINIEELGLLYIFLVENKDEIIKKIKPHNNKNIYRLYKYLINSFYGLIISNDKYYVDKPKLITHYLSDFYNNLINNYKDDIIYIDVDMFIIKKYNNDIMNQMKFLDIPFDIVDVKKLYIINKKRYAMFSEDGVNVKNVNGKTHGGIIDEINNYARSIKLKRLITKI